MALYPSSLAHDAAHDVRDRNDRRHAARRGRKDPLTLADLHDAGYAQDVVEAVDSLTRREGETCQELVARAGSHPIARKVKIADLEDHLDLRWSRDLQDEDLERLRRYRQAWLYLAGE
jgi:hypothetical protein